MKSKAFIKDAIILFIITLISGISLGFVYEITKEPIAQAKIAAKSEAYKKVFETADNFKENEEKTDKIETLATEISSAGFGNVVIDEVVEAYTGDTLAGHVITATSKEGYGGNIQITVGINIDGTVTGIEFLSISETAGLGMNATNPEFYTQYAGKNVESFTVTKSDATSDSDIVAISGATITSNAVTNAVNAALYFVRNLQ